MIRIIFTTLFSFLLLSAKHIGPDYDVKPRESLDRFATRLAKKYHLKFLNSGLGTFAGSQKALWGISLTSKDKMTFEEGRTLARQIAFELLEHMYNDPSYGAYLKHAAPRGRPPECLEESLVAYRLAFWDENVDRPLYPYLAQIRLCDGKIYYHYANKETQALEEPIVESLDSLGIPGHRQSA